MVLFVTPTKEDQFLGTDWLLWDVLCTVRPTQEKMMYAVFTLCLHSVHHLSLCRKVFSVLRFLSNPLGF